MPNACLIGNLTQEVASASEPIRLACAEALGGWAAEIAPDLAAAKAERASAADFSPESVAQHFVAVFEGALVLSKAFNDRSVIASSLTHFRAYVEQLFVSR